MTYRQLELENITLSFQISHCKPSDDKRAARASEEARLSFQKDTRAREGGYLSDTGSMREVGPRKIVFQIWVKSSLRHQSQFILMVLSSQI